MVRLDLCVDYNGGGGGCQSIVRRDVGGGSKFMDQKGRREVRVGFCITTRLRREVRWVGGGVGCGCALGSKGTETECGSLFLNQHRLGPLCRGVCQAT